MSKDIIYREDAIKAVENVSENYTKEGDREWHPHIDFITQALVQVPSVSDRPSAVDLSSVYSTAYKSGYEKGKADRPQGEWIDMGDFEQCSVCKGTHLKEFQSYYGKTTWIKTPYCPSCGSRMKGADDE